MQQHVGAWCELCTTALECITAASCSLLSHSPWMQVMDKLCAAVAITKASSTVRAYLLTALTKLAAQQQQQVAGGAAGADAVLRPEAREALHKARSSRNAELQQRAQEAEALLRWVGPRLVKMKHAAWWLCLLAECMQSQRSHTESCSGRW